MTSRSCGHYKNECNNWLAVSGPPKEVMEEQQHRPGEMGLSDFTEFKAATITINGQPFDHLLYHYRERL